MINFNTFNEINETSSENKRGFVLKNHELVETSKKEADVFLTDSEYDMYKKISDSNKKLCDIYQEKIHPLKDLVKGMDQKLLSDIKKITK